MATYAVGDVQGCFDQLLALLDEIAFSPSDDTLWLAGDLVNRGPKSLQVLRFVRELGDSAICVLGNHDLHLIATHYGQRRPSRKDTLSEVLDAPDRDELLRWLRERPLMHHDPLLDTVMVHAGLAPQWSIDDAAGCARELESVLRDDDAIDTYLAAMYGNAPARWSDDLSGNDRLRYITNAFTRMRYVDARGCLDLDEKGPPSRAPGHLTPWFAVDDRASAGTRIVFGHWATLRLEQAPDRMHRVIHLDTGCVWGGPLSGVRLDDETPFTVEGYSPPSTTVLSTASDRRS